MPFGPMPPQHHRLKSVRSVPFSGAQAPIEDIESLEVSQGRVRPSSGHWRQTLHRYRWWFYVLVPLVWFFVGLYLSYKLLAVGAVLGVFWFLAIGTHPAVAAFKLGHDVVRDMTDD